MNWLSSIINFEIDSFDMMIVYMYNCYWIYVKVDLYIKNSFLCILWFWFGKIILIDEWIVSW